MKITTEEIAVLRKQTNAGIMDCKKALEEAKGKMDEAKKILRKQGLVKAAKKQGRETKAGIIKAYVHSGDTVGVLVKLVCETDFVARNEEFKKLAHEIALQIAGMNPKDVQTLLKQDYIRDSQKKIDDLVKETIAKVGENIKIDNFFRLSLE